MPNLHNYAVRRDDFHFFQPFDWPLRKLSSDRLSYLHVELPAPPGAGGLLLVLVALELLTGKAGDPDKLATAISAFVTEYRHSQL